MGLLARVGNYISTSLSPSYPRLPKNDKEIIVLRDVDSPKSVYAHNDFWQLSYSGWTFEQVQSALDQSEQGVLREITQLMVAMMRDPMFYHGVMTRIMSFLGCPFLMKNTEGFPTDLYDTIRSEWKTILPKHTLATILKHRICIGVAPAEVFWYVKNKRWLPKIRAKHPANLFFNLNSKKYSYSGKDKIYIINPDGKEWILFQGLGEIAPYLDGACRALAVVWFLKQEAIRLWQNYARVHGTPIRKVTVPGQQRESDDVKLLVARAQKLLGGQVFTAPMYEDGLKYDLSLVEATGNSYLTFVDLIALYDKYITLVLLGAIENTQSLPYGSRAKAEVAEKQTNKYLYSDCDEATPPLVPVFEAICEYNRIDTDLYPYCSFDGTTSGDLLMKAQVGAEHAKALNAASAAMKDMNEAGIKYDAEYIYNQCGMELTKKANLEDRVV